MATELLKLTKWEAEQIEWAFGAMSDYWGADCKAGEAPSPGSEGVVENELTIPAGATMPFIEDQTLALSTWGEINDDLLYRIGEQLPDMADNAASIGGDVTPQQAGRIITKCEVLADKIRAAMEMAA